MTEKYTDRYLVIPERIAEDEVIRTSFRDPPSMVKDAGKVRYFERDRR